MRKLGGRERGILFVGWGPINVSTCWPIKHVKILTVQAYKRQTPFLAMFYHIGHNLKLKTQSQHHCLIPCFHDADIAMAEKNVLESFQMVCAHYWFKMINQFKLQFFYKTMARNLNFRNFSDNIICSCSINNNNDAYGCLWYLDGLYDWIAIAVINCYQARPALMVLIPVIQFPRIAILTSQGARGHDQIHPDL